MNKPITYYHVVLDRSGSMASCWGSAMKALHNQYEQIQSTKAKYPDQEMMYSWCIFNEEIIMSESIAPVNANLRLPNAIHPDGLTALHDAVGSSIEFLKKHTGTEIESNPKADVVMIVITDGEENASRFFTGPGVKRMIHDLEATEKWTFLFVGLDMELESIARDCHMARGAKIRFCKGSFDEDFESYSMKISENLASQKFDKIKKKFSFKP
jgi:hypothetical protein